MRKIQIAVCDADSSYGERLSMWISREKEDRFYVSCFSTPEALLKYGGKKDFDIVLLGRGFWNDERIGRMREDGAGKEALWLCLQDPLSLDKFPDWGEGIPVLEKYQPAPRMVREILSYYREGSKGQAEIFGKREVVGVYSPSHSIWQAPFSLTLAQELSRKEKTLYVSFQECAGFREWFSEDYQCDLMDAMYLCLANEDRVEDCIGSIAYTLDGVDYIPPADDGACLGEVSKEDYRKFVGLLGEKSGYEVVVLDFGMMVPGFFDLLGSCSRAYILSEDGELQGGPLSQFRQMLDSREIPDAEGKFRYLRLPAFAEKSRSGGSLMQQWSWGTVGDYTRSMMGVQGGED